MTEPDRYINGLQSLGTEVGHYRDLQILDMSYFRLYKMLLPIQQSCWMRNISMSSWREVRIDSWIGFCGQICWSQKAFLIDNLRLFHSILFLSWTMFFLSVII